MIHILWSLLSSGDVSNNKNKKKKQEKKQKLYNRMSAFIVK